jgi:hypothetical protein
MTFSLSRSAAIELDLFQRDGLSYSPDVTARRLAALAVRLPPRDGNGDEMGIALVLDVFAFARGG